MTQFIIVPILGAIIGILISMLRYRKQLPKCRGCHRRVRELKYYCPHCGTFVPTKGSFEILESNYDEQRQMYTIWWRAPRFGSVLMSKLSESQQQSMEGATDDQKMYLLRTSRIMQCGGKMVVVYRSYESHLDIWNFQCRMADGTDFEVKLSGHEEKRLWQSTAEGRAVFLLNQHFVKDYRERLRIG